MNPPFLRNQFGCVRVLLALLLAGAPASVLSAAEAQSQAQSQAQLQAVADSPAASLSAAPAGDTPVGVELGEDTNRGLAVFREADRRQSGFGDMLVQLTMVLRNRRGSEVERELDLKQLEVPEGGDKLMVVFQTPKAIRGTALLSHGQVTREDDQWLYLPALKRVKKIASRNRSGPFLGSEFSYEDLSTQEVAKYSYKYLREEACGEGRCYVVERKPGPALYSGYLRQVYWLDSEHYRTVKVDYYNRGDRLTKTLLASEFEQFPNGIWKPRLMQMSNKVTGKSTDLIWRDFEFDVGLSADRDLSTTSLLRVR